MSSEAAYKLSKEVQKVITEATSTIEEEVYPNIFNFLAAGMVAVSAYAYIV